MPENLPGARRTVGVPVSWLDQSLDILSRVETPVDIGRSAADIYAYLLDFPRHVEWAHTYLSVERLAPGETQVGSRFRVREKQDLRSDKRPFTTIADRAGTDYTSEVEVTALDPDRRVEWTSRVADQPLSAVWQVELDPVADTITTVRMSAKLTAPRPALEAWMHQLQAAGQPLDIIARQVDRALHNLRTILEGRAGGPR